MRAKVRRRPVYMIGVAADLIGVHPQTLRMYEQKGILCPRKSIKNTRLYSQEDVERGQYIQRLTRETGMNLAGVKKVLDMESRIDKLESENARLQRELRRTRDEHERVLSEVHRSYKRELVVLPRGEIEHALPRRYKLGSGL
ncbi:MAG: helix-turn-helix transcriptional regulator [Rubrobacter sp.]|nr:helix-turn-helix transcriptional regulator [Rubrobacter sp.]